MSVTIKELETVGEHGDCKIIHGVRRDDIPTLIGSDGDFIAFVLNEDGILRTQAQQHRIIDPCSATTGWSVLGNDTINLATTTNHVLGTVALEFDKVNGAANTVVAGIQKTITSIDFTPYHKGGGFCLTSFYLSAITDVDYVFLRLGTDNSNYNEWRIDADDLNGGWDIVRFSMLDPATVVGNGWNSAVVTYVSVGVAFDAETDELADIAVDHIATNTGLMTSVPIVETRNVNLLKIKNKVVDTQDGNVGTGTQRITIATDDVNLAAIKTAIEILDNAISGTEMQVDVVTSALPTGAATSAKQLADGHNVKSNNVNIATETTVNSIKTAVEILDNFISGTRGLVTEDNSNAIKNALEIMDDWESSTVADAADIVDKFTGAAYSLSKASTDTATLIEASAKLCRDIVIQNSHASYEVLLGDDSTPEYELKGGEKLGFTKIDLNTLYLKSKDAGEHATIQIIGVNE